MSAAERLRELKQRREFDTPTDRETWRDGQFAEYAILDALPEIIAVVEKAEKRLSAKKELAALDAKLASR